MNNALLSVNTTFRVLYLERDPDTALAFIKAYGQHVVIKALDDADEALAYLREGNVVDLVIINEQLGGFAFLETVRNSPILKQTPVLLMTPHLTPEVQQRALRLQAIDVFPVPFRFEDLQLRLNYLIRRKAYLNNRPLADTTKNVIQPTQVKLPLWKRSLDVAISASVLLALSPVMLAAAMAIRLDSPGPILYRSKRVGSGYRVFSMYKFRTMRPNADQLISAMADLNIYNQTAPKAEAPRESRCETCRLLGTGCQRMLFLEDQQVCEHDYMASKRAKAMFTKFREDPRVTRLGRFLRNTSIDELPQLFNILKGDMSLVGNRPLPPYEAERLTTTGYAQRFAAPAGLTGLWQVMKRGKGQPTMSDLERIQLDVQYAETFSLRTDINIMLKTLTAVWQRENV